jgi:hypothetical protein
MLREGWRAKAALKLGHLASIMTLAGFDFTFQSSLDRNRKHAVRAAGRAIWSIWPAAVRVRRLVRRR